jgi:osmoprotectant transport system substrate-binding protein
VRLIASSVVLAVALALAGCGGGHPGPAKHGDTTPVRIGTKNFTESQILGELYKQALEAKGFRVDLQSGVGPTEVTNRALRDGFLDMYPEYVGVLLSEVDKIVKRPASPLAAYNLAKKIEQGRKFTLLDQTRLSDENALAVKTSFGKRYGITSIPDLARLPHGAILGAAPEFRNRFEGMIGLRERYGLRSLKMRAVDVGKGAQYPQLNSGALKVALVFTTDSQLARGHYTLLSDPKGVFAKNHVAPVISQKALALHGPRLAQTLNDVSAVLTTPVMRMLNAKVDIDKRSPSDVADEFLRANNLKIERPGS